MSLLALVVARLEAQEIRFAVIGATAMAVHGVSRSTADIDLLTMDRRALEPSVWSKLDDGAIDISIRRGDSEDPLAGVVRARSSGERAVDLIVGKPPWQVGIIERASPESVGDVELQVVRASDLVLLKLYAGGPQDAWDIHQLLAADDRADLVLEVNGRIEELDRSARELWLQIREE